VLTAIERLLSFQLTIVEILCIGVVFGVPYLAMGIAWTSTHSAHLDQLQGVDLMMSILGSILLWPAVGFAGVCLS
jgi:apolipoprotein N-acyltransferase